MDHVEAVHRSRDRDHRAEFDRRLREQVESVRAAFEAGYDADFAVGLELEGYAIDEEGHLTRAPEAAFGTACERELGRHNAEVNTPVTAFTADGFAEGAEALADRVAATERAFADAGCRFVTDGMWTRGPPEGAVAYLTAGEERDGVWLAANVSPVSRYHALDADITANGPVELDVPGCRRTFDSIVVESLATSMQVHLQPPTAAFTRYFNTALRTVGPLVALAANAPFLPPELYDADADPEVVLDGFVELRIPVFESMNVAVPGKVRLPRDLDAPAGLLDHFLEDRRCAPYLREWTTDAPREGFVDDHWELLHAQSTCWRWVRPVLGPEGPRIEYRTLAAQPSVADVVSMQALVVGLVHGVVATDHPLLDLPWADAEAGLYAAARDGFDADLPWVARDGDRITDPADVYPDLFATARAGLRDRGFPTDRVDSLLGPLERRWETRTTPATWKRERVRERYEDGASLADAIEAAGAAYLDRCGTPFDEWPA